VTEAWAYACEKPLEPGWPYLVYEKFVSKSQDYAAGFAFAKAIAEAKTTCKSRGNAYGCAGAYAKARAWADATITAHAEAWSEAVGKCDCDKTQEAAATADGVADEFKYILAKVEAVASASVCVKGDDYGSDTDAQTCVQDIYARAFASVRFWPSVQSSDWFMPHAITAW
jgi:hypothetical protein